MTIFDEAVALIPSYIDAEAENQRTHHLLSAVGIFTDDAAQDAYRRYSDLIRSSDDLDEIIDALEVFNAAKSRLAAVSQIRTDLFAHRNFVRGIRRKPTPDEIAPALAFLRDQLRDLVSRVREIDTVLGDITDASTAMQGAKAQAWLELEEAVSKYIEIRTAQHRITIRINEGGMELRDAFARHGYIRNSFEDEAYWVNVARHVAAWRKVPNDGFAPPLVKWAKNPPALKWTREPNEHLPQTDPTGYLRWLATHSTPWIPTIHELQTAQRQAEAMSSSFSDLTEVRAALDAYDAYYADITPRRSLDTATLRAKLPEQRKPGRRRVEDPPTPVHPAVLAITGE